ncbi:MAG: hypothetical protein P8R54_30095 [Myxococcota bacterium]|nr:hypothetical protein [Myxococcota bacterium]
MVFTLLLVACDDGTTDSGQGSSVLELFCEDVADGGTYELEESQSASIDGANGSLIARIVTDESDDTHNPNFVADVTYIIENLDVGGSPRYGESDISGEVAATLGEGNWFIQISNNRVAGFDCYNEASFTIEAGMTTFLCLDVNCE